MKKSDIKWFEARGYSWEYPGFIDRSLSRYSFTVGHSDPAKPELFTVQICLDGEYVTGSDFKTKEEVHAYYLALCKDAPAIYDVVPTHEG